MPSLRRTSSSMKADNRDNAAKKPDKKQTICGINRKFLVAVDDDITTTTLASMMENSINDAALQTTSALAISKTMSKPLSDTSSSLHNENKYFHQNNKSNDKIILKTIINNSHNLLDSSDNNSKNNNVVHASHDTNLMAAKTAKQRTSLVDNNRNFSDAEDVGLITNSQSNITTSSYCVSISDRDTYKRNLSMHGKSNVNDETSRNSSFRSGSSVRRSLPQPIVRDLPTPNDIMLENTTTESQYSSRKNSTSTIAHDLDMIELLERERSMDLQEMVDNYGTTRYSSGTSVRRRESGDSNRFLVNSSVVSSGKLARTEFHNANPIYVHNRTARLAENMDGFSDNYVPDPAIRSHEEFQNDNSHYARSISMTDSAKATVLERRYSNRSKSQFFTSMDESSSTKMQKHRQYVNSNSAFPSKDFGTDL